MLNTRLSSLFLLTITGLLTGCNNSEEINDSIDDLPTPYNASVSHINMTGTTTSFYTRSSVYFDDVFSPKYKVVELLPETISQTYTHHWPEGYNTTDFAVQESSTGAQRGITQSDLSHGENYWHVALNQSEYPELSIFKKAPVHNQNGFTIRVISTSNDEIYADNQTIQNVYNQPGEVSNQFLIESCSGFFVGDVEIDLCQFGEVGQSYLVVVDTLTWTHLIADEAT